MNHCFRFFWISSTRWRFTGIGVLSENPPCFNSDMVYISIRRESAPPPPPPPPAPPNIYIYVYIYIFNAYTWEIIKHEWGAMYPVNTKRNKHVIIMSKRRFDVSCGCNSGTHSCRCVVSFTEYHGKHIEISYFVLFCKNQLSPKYGNTCMTIRGRLVIQDIVAWPQVSLFLNSWV